jgi:hypothetical protein
LLAGRRYGNSGIIERPAPDRNPEIKSGLLFSTNPDVPPLAVSPLPDEKAHQRSSSCEIFRSQLALFWY